MLVITNSLISIYDYGCPCNKIILSFKPSGQWLLPLPSPAMVAGNYLSFPLVGLEGLWMRLLPSSSVLVLYLTSHFLSKEKNITKNLPIVSNKERIKMKTCDIDILPTIWDPKFSLVNTPRHVYRYFILTRLLL